MEVINQVNLFNLGQFTLSNGQQSNFKIDCDALTDEDIKTIAFLLSGKLKYFREAYGVPTGGERLAKVLNQYFAKFAHKEFPILICDDVFTTGKSIENFAGEICSPENTTNYIGCVIFARNPVPSWITPLFKIY